jgi:hypothetical protein|tara:strand:- start:174 stop:716 length:543 start_codon:yes stop_codon:yes gene_type:complete
MELDWTTTLLVGLSTAAGVGMINYAYPFFIGWIRGDRFVFCLDNEKIYDSTVLATDTPVHNGWFRLRNGLEIAQVGSYAPSLPTAEPSTVKVLRFKVDDKLVRAPARQIVGSHIFSPPWLLSKLGSTEHKKGSILTTRGKVVTADLAKGEYLHVSDTDVSLARPRCTSDKTLDIGKLFEQ